jgi:hypothetical protein
MYIMPQTKLLGNPTYATNFGYSISISLDGNVAAIGDLDDRHFLNGNAGEQIGNGAVFVYEKNKECKWILVTTLFGDSFSRGFGHSVALSGDGNTLVVGDPDDAVRTNGAVYIYKRNDKLKWTKVNKLEVGTRSLINGYGFSVAINESGNIIAVGDIQNRENQNGASGTGAVWIYKLNENSKWKQMCKLFGDQKYSAQFGFSVSLSDDGKRLVVGDNNDTENGTTALIDGLSGIGAVYVYYLQDDGKWKRQAKFLPNARFGSQFGGAVNISGDGTTIAVGDNKDSENGRIVGAVSVYTLNCESKWKLQTKILGNARYSGGDTAINGFGVNVVLSQDGSILFIGDSNNSEAGTNTIVIVGVPNIERGIGAVWKYKLIDCKWKKEDTILGNSRFSANYGVVIDISRNGEIAIIGDQRNIEAGTRTFIGNTDGFGAVFIIEKPLNNTSI